MLNVTLHPSQRTKFSITPDRDQRQDHSLMKAHIIKYLHNMSMVMYKARISYLNRNATFCQFPCFIKVMTF